MDFTDDEYMAMRRVARQGGVSVSKVILAYMDAAFGKKLNAASLFIATMRYNASRKTKRAGSISFGTKSVITHKDSARRSAHVSGSKGVRRARANGLTSAAGKEVAE